MNHVQSVARNLDAKRCLRDAAPLSVALHGRPQPLVTLTTCAGPCQFSQKRDASSPTLGPEESGHMHLCARLNGQASQQEASTRSSLCTLWRSVWYYPPAYGPAIHLVGLCGRACGPYGVLVVATRPASLLPSVFGGRSCRSLVLGLFWDVDCARALFRACCRRGQPASECFTSRLASLCCAFYGEGLAGSDPGLARM